MPRITRWSVPFALALLLGCQDQPVAPDSVRPEPSFAKGRPAPTLQAPLDLDEGVYARHYGNGVSDAGWVIAGNLDGLGLVSLTLTPHDWKELPATVGTSPGLGNGRGDYIAEDGSARLMLRGDAGWALSQALHAPAGWPDTVHLNAINDARLVVGWAKDPNRCTTSSQGGTTTTFCRSSPLAWTFDEAAQRWTPFAMTLPAASDPASCQVRQVFPVRVNDAGVVVGLATEETLTRRAVCPNTRAIVWETATGPAATLPTAAALAGYDYTPGDINDRGDIGGTASKGNDYRAVRWRHGTGTIEVLNGFYAYGDLIDECGRVIARQGYLWETDGSVTVRLVAPADFTSLRFGDVAGKIVAGWAFHSTLGVHALVWTLPACQ